MIDARKKTAMAGALLCSAAAILLALGGTASAHGDDDDRQYRGYGPGMMGPGMMGGYGPGMMGPGMMGGYGPGMMGPGMMGGYGPMMGYGNAESLGEALKEHDADGNGTLSLEEFEAFQEAIRRRAIVDRFQAFDDDGNGQIDADEMTAPARQWERWHEQMEQQMERYNDDRAPGRGGMMDDQGQRRQNGTPRGGGMMNDE